MLPDFWYHPATAFLWQTALHSAVAAALLYAWSRRLNLPSGRLRRRLHALVLTIPLLTAALPWRSDLLFRDDRAFFDSYRFLALPLTPWLRMYHAMLVLGALTVLVSLRQELLPLLRRSQGSTDNVPADLLRKARELPGWRNCRVEMLASRDLEVATSGSLQRPRLLVSQGAVERFSAPELIAVLHHENAHWQRGRWRAIHGLYGIRLAQIFNPIALWIFREYVIETEIDCDLDAARITGNRPLARALLAVYQDTSRDDVSARTVLRRRIDVLLGDATFDDGPLPSAILGFAALILVGALPWLV